MVNADELHNKSMVDFVNDCFANDFNPIRVLMYIYPDYKWRIAESNIQKSSVTSMLHVIVAHNGSWVVFTPKHKGGNGHKEPDRHLLAPSFPIKEIIRAEPNDILNKTLHQLISDGIMMGVKLLGPLRTIYSEYVWAFSPPHDTNRNYPTSQLIDVGHGNLIVYTLKSDADTGADKKGGFAHRAFIGHKGDIMASLDDMHSKTLFAFIADCYNADVNPLPFLRKVYPNYKWGHMNPSDDSCNLQGVGDVIYLGKGYRVVFTPKTEVDTCSDP